MSRNGSGTYTVPNTFVAGTTITASDHNENWSDVGAEVTNSLAIDGQSTMTGPIKAAPGTVSAPGITFGVDLDTGAYRIGANNIGVAAGGSKVLDVSSSGLSVTGTLTASSTMTASNGLAVTTGGATVTAGGLTVTAGGLTVSADTIIAPVGSVTAPTYAFSGDANCGFYHIAADNIGVTCAGAKVLDISATGLAVTGAVTGTTVTATNVAAQSDQETATSTTTFVSPGRQQYHPSAPKCWVQFNPSVVVSSSYAISSVTDVGTGAWSPNFSTAFSSNGYSLQATIGVNVALIVGSNPLNNRTSTTAPIISLNTSGSVTDTSGFIDFVAFGDL